MKTFLLTIICLFLMSGCLQESHKRERRLAGKGIELYSWHPASENWYFSLHFGTNRNKTIEEITNPKRTIIGAENLKHELAKFPEGESVFWENYAKEPVPSAIINDLEAYSKKIKIKLYKPWRTN